MKKTKLAAAKINLLLDLTGIFPNGYHGIYTVMQSVGVFDTVSVEKTDSGISLDCRVADSLKQADGVFTEIPCDSRNTAYQAAARFADYTGAAVGARIEIEKRIPSGAGLAGGSADAAAVIALLNETYDAGLSERQLCEIGTAVGADVPFCLTGGTRLAQNIGELLTPLPPLSGFYIVIVKPRSSVSTGTAYGAYDALEHVRHPAKEDALNAYLRRDYARFFALSSNVFEQAVEVPGRAEIKAVMRAFGCAFAQMSGSGSAIFGLFAEKDACLDCADALRAQGHVVFCADPEPAGLKTLQM